MNQHCLATRRQFLRETAVASTVLAAPCFIPARSLGGEGAVAPSERLVIGLIGAGGMGLAHLHWLLDQPDLEVAALCDVDDGHLQQARELVRSKGRQDNCPTYRDFRELLARPDVDAVFVVTPDHWHALVAIAAVEAGKDVYCEKPLTNSVGEGRALCEAVKKHGRVLQCGSQERSNPNVRRARELVRSGRLGDVKTVRVFLPCDEPHHQRARAQELVLADVPAGFNYNFWLGPTEVVPYAENRCHFGWRFNHRYGGGEMTDRGAHIIDLAQLALQFDDAGPVEYRASGTRLEGGLYDVFLDFEFENVYANGVKLIGEKTGPRGIRFEGDQGSLFVHIHGGKLQSNPASLLDDVPPAEPFDAYALHRRDFFAAVRSRDATHATAEIGHRTATICHLNNLAMRLGRPLKWDPVAEKIIGDEEAHGYLMPKMRAPWSV
jgi:predicted dehydrogenase